MNQLWICMWCSFLILTENRDNSGGWSNYWKQIARLPCMLYLSKAHRSRKVV
jgi:hypothetical protein